MGRPVSPSKWRVHRVRKDLRGSSIYPRPSSPLRAGIGRRLNQPSAFTFGCPMSHQHKDSRTKPLQAVALLLWYCETILKDGREICSEGLPLSSFKSTWIFRYSLRTRI